LWAEAQSQFEAQVGADAAAALRSLMRTISDPRDSAQRLAP
jgi:hypothetical protein